MRDSSTVYHIDALDDEQRANFSPDLPWIWESEGDLQTFGTEAEACAYQRQYRRAINCDEMTGEKL